MDRLGKMNGLKIVEKLLHFRFKNNIESMDILAKMNRQKNC